MATSSKNLEDVASATSCFRKDVIEIFDVNDDLNSDNVKPRIVDFSENAALQKYYKELRENRVEDTDKISAVEPTEELKLRHYQEELAAPALAGANTIVCAPTGSGKTIVAVKVIADHLDKLKLTGSSGKVAFLVPTATLVDQQKDVLDRHLHGRYKTYGLKGGQISGTNKTPKKVIVLHSDIIVVTPQLLLNMITIKTDDSDLILKITDFSLFVFDECHHADKCHAYNEIMVLYFDIKLNKDRKPDETLPQVLGLTASLGVGQADTLQKACEHIWKICANLDVKKLSLVKKYKDELENFVYTPKDELVRKCARYDHPFSNDIIDIMKNIEDQLKPIFDHIEGLSIKHVGNAFAVPDKRWSAKYAGWVYGWYYFASKLENIEFKRQLITYMEHLMVYHITLDLNVHVPMKIAFEYLCEEMATKLRKQTTQLDKSLLALYNSKKDALFVLITKSSEAITNSIVHELKQILLREYKENGDSRTLIFVRTRELARSVERYLNSEPELLFLNAGRLTGVNAKKDEGGQTDSEQQEILERFRNGQHKVVVATTVAEEGLDIEKCNIVIKYNHVTNEIAMVQRRGRGRTIGSKSILLTHEGWIEEKEIVNLIREQLMYRAVQEMLQNGETKFAEHVEQQEIKSFNERKNEKQQRELKRIELGNRRFDIRCYKCDKLVSSSSKIRCVQNQHFVCIDPNVWSLLSIEPTNSPMLFESLSVAGKMSCLECRLDNGGILKYQQVFLPTFKIESFVLVTDLTNERVHVKKWKQVQDRHFVVNPLDHSELMPMFNALKAEDREHLDKVLEQAEAEEAAAIAMQEAAARELRLKMTIRMQI